MTGVLDRDQIAARLAGLDGWSLSEDGQSIARHHAVKGFARAVEMANLAAWLGNSRNHHPDVCFGWGYCRISFTTHDAGGLTEADFACAARLDALTAEGR